MNVHFTKGLLSFFCLCLALLALTGVLDTKGAVYTDQTLKRALVAFGMARGLNGVISVAQGTEIALQPAGVGLNFAPGEILDPINDLVERFSWIMLASSASLGVQKILLEMSAWFIFSFLVILVLVFTAIAAWIPAIQRTKLMKFLIKLSFVLILLRFSVPLIAISSELIYKEFLSPQYLEATESLQETTRNIRTVNKSASKEIPKGGDLSILDSAKKFYNSAVTNLDIEARIERYKKAAANATKHTINLIVIFIVQTILFPLVFIFGVYLLGKSLIRSTHSYISAHHDDTLVAK